MDTFIEDSEGKLSVQTETFCEGIDKQVTNLGLTKVKVDKFKLSNNFWQFLFAITNTGILYSHEMVAYKKLFLHGPGTAMMGEVPVLAEYPTPMPGLTPSNFRTQFAELIGDCKKSPNFTESIGIGLGIVKVPISNAGPMVEFSPNLSVKPAMGGHPLLHATKGNYQGYELYKDWGDGKGFVHFKTSLTADFLDNSPFPPIGTSEVWRYKAIYLKKSEEVGILSAIVSITVVGAE